MYIFITADANGESGIHEVSGDLITRTAEHFEPLDYGPGLAGLVLVFMCRDPSCNFRRRVTLRKADRVLLMDIMFHLPAFLDIEQEERRQRVIRQLIRDVPETIARYKIKTFDLARFTADWTVWLTDLPPEPPRDPNEPLSPDIYARPKYPLPTGKIPRRTRG